MAETVANSSNPMQNPYPLPPPSLLQSTVPMATPPYIATPTCSLSQSTNFVTQDPSITLIATPCFQSQPGKKKRKKKKQKLQTKTLEPPANSASTTTPPPPHPFLNFPQPQLSGAPNRPQPCNTEALNKLLNLPQPQLQHLLNLPQPQLLDPVNLPQPQLPAPSSTPTPTPTPVTATAPTPDTVSHSQTPVSLGLPESLLYKNRLQEYTQRSSLPLPEYRTVKEVNQHPHQFRSSVTVDGICYTSPNAFLTRKDAERDVAKLAMECITKKIKEEGFPLIHRDTVFCKSILNELAAKMNLPTLTYNTVQSEGLIPVFVSSLVFNGTIYTGDPGRSKKEAEQLAARAAILSLMDDSGFGTCLYGILKSKGKLFDALYKVKDLNRPHNSFVPEGVKAGNDCGISHMQDQVVEAPVPAVSQPASAISEACTRTHPPHHEFKVPTQDQSYGAINPPIVFVPPVQQPMIAFVPPVQQQPLGVVPNLGASKKRKKKKRANKNVRADVQ